MNKDNFNIFILFLTIIYSGGCAVLGDFSSRFPDSKNLQDIDPSEIAFAIVYYPYGPALVRSNDTPLPDYSQWTNKRMRRDFERLRDTGIDLVLVGVSTDDFSDTTRIERYRSLLQLRQENPEWPKLAFFVTSINSKANRLQAEVEIIQWLFEVQIRQSQGYYRINNRPLVIVVSETAKRIRHPAFRLINASSAPAGWFDWMWGVQKMNSSAVSNRNGSQVWVDFQSSRQEDISISERFMGINRAEKAILPAFRKGVMHRPKYLVINSWNNYADKSFIEPTEEEAYHRSQTLSREIKRLQENQ